MAALGITCEVNQVVDFWNGGVLEGFQRLIRLKEVK
jgi:hypothetical protein